MRPPVAAEGEAGRGVTVNGRAFRLMVRNELFRWVELLSRRAYVDLAERLPDATWRAEALAEAMAPYWEVHGSVGIDGAARAVDLCQIVERSDGWSVRQVLVDPDGDQDWAVTAAVDLAASDEEGRAVVALRGVGPVG